MENKVKENDWIPVSSAKYPQKHQNVYVTVNDGEKAKCIVAYMEYDGCWYGDETDCLVGHVTAWKPMQEIEPYKAEEATENEKESEDNDGWISCSVKFPEDSTSVQVTYKSFYGKLFCDAFAYVTNGKWYWVEDDTACGAEITAWKPMCKPYTPQKG